MYDKRADSVFDKDYLGKYIGVTPWIKIDNRQKVEPQEDSNDEDYSDTELLGYALNELDCSRETLVEWFKIDKEYRDRLYLGGGV